MVFLWKYNKKHRVRASGVLEAPQLISIENPIEKIIHFGPMEANLFFTMYNAKLKRPVGFAMVVKAIMLNQHVA